ncbi:MAG: AAA family ATPase [Candidatus Omnitrophota bacterium]
MYEAYWSLREKPFENTPDPKYIYYSKKHKEAVARLLYAVREHKGAALLTGEYGSGKTLLSRVLWHELQQEKIYQSVFILNPRLCGLEMLQEITQQLSGNEAPANKIDLFHSLHNILYANHNLSRHTVIVVDEAQAIMENEIFEELRLLLNFQLDNAFLLTLILLGQPELRQKIVNLPQLSQRMSLKFHLSALDEQETKGYIQHRLKLAGASQNIFDDEAHEGIYFFSAGIPRRINNICDLALLIGFAEGEKVIGKKTILKVCEDSENMSHPGFNQEKFMEEKDV